MIYLAAASAVAAFLWAFGRLGVVSAARQAAATSRIASRALRDSSLSEAEKERRTQQASITLAVSFVSIGVRGGGAVAASLIPLLAFHFVGVAPLDQTIGWLATWEAIALFSGTITAFYLVRRLF